MTLTLMMNEPILHRLARSVLPKRVWVRLARLPRHPRKYVRRFGWGPGMAAYGALAGLKRGVVEVPRRRESQRITGCRVIQSILEDRDSNRSLRSVKRPIGLIWR